MNENFYTLVFRRKQKFKRKPFNAQEYWTTGAKNPEEAKQKLITKYGKSGLDKETIQCHLIDPGSGHAGTRKINKKWKRPRTPKVQLVRSTNKQRNREVIQAKQKLIKELARSASFLAEKLLTQV